MFNKLLKNRKKRETLIEEIENEINSSEEWINFYEELNKILKNKHKLYNPTIKTIVRENSIYFYSLEYINKDFEDIFRIEKNHNKIITKDLFSANNIVSIKENYEYQIKKENLIKYLSKKIEEYEEKTNKILKELKITIQEENIIIKEIEAKLNENFNNKKEKLMKLITKYFEISPEVKIDFFTYMDFRETKYNVKLSQKTTYYSIHFYIGRYNSYNILPLAELTFSLEDINNTIKFRPMLINNINIISKKSSAKNFLRTTVRNNIKNILIQTYKENE